MSVDEGGGNVSRHLKKNITKFESADIITSGSQTVTA